MADDAGDDRANAMAEAFLQHRLMEETQQYLSRGRRFEATPDEELRLYWTEAFRKWFQTRSPGHVREPDDLSAELRLRGQDPPYDSVKAELSRMREEIRDYESDSDWQEEIAKRIAEFRETMNKPSS
jgi:hypothetical protein